MKAIFRNVPKILSLCLAVILLSGTVNAQSKEEKKAQKEAAMKALVESKNYQVTAQSVTPQGARTRQLTSEYTFKVAADSILSDLPYFGRAYSANLDPNSAGIQFNSKDFEYTSTPGKKGGWDVVIKPKDVTDVQRVNLSISGSGNCYIQVTSTNRQPISYNGYISERKPR
jgi:hypothetical protein